MNPTSIPRERLIQHLRHANRVAIAAINEGKHPFGAVLVDATGLKVLLEQGNVDTVNHAETVLARAAAAKYGQEFLWECTLYTTVEPCAMCSGAIYWANIGQVVYGMSERELLKLTGNHSANPTLDLPCRIVFEHGQKDIKVDGPIREVEEEIANVHRSFWKTQTT